MNAGFFHWYAVSAPSWLVGLFLNMHKALLQFFSVSIMLKTLFAHWRKDVVSYNGDITTRITSFAWNQISRGIGFMIRVSVLAIWVVAEIIFILLASSLFLLFIIWPFMIIAGFFMSIVLLF